MILQKVKPTTSSRRQLVKLNQKSLNLSKKPLLKQKLKGKKNSTGRNHSGQITVFHKGGGVKRKYREVNFSRTFNSTGIVCTLEHDPNRNAFIAAIFDFLTINNTINNLIMSPNFSTTFLKENDNSKKIILAEQAADLLFTGVIDFNSFLYF